MEPHEKQNNPERYEDSQDRQVQENQDRTQGKKQEI